MQTTVHIGDFQIELWRIGAAVLSVFLGFIAKRIAGVVLKKLKRVQEMTKTHWDDVVIGAVESPLYFGLVMTGIGVALLILPFPEEPLNFPRFFESLLKGLGAVVVVWFALRLIDGISQQLAVMAERTESRLDDQVLPIIRSTLKVVAVIIGAMLVIQNLGYSIGSLLAGLGLGGAALALASKDTVANLFGSIVIFVDRPFQIGDWVEIGSIEGTVEEVGLRTTRIRTFANSLITLPNHILTTSAIENWSEMQKRRITLTVGVTYDSKPDQVSELVESFRRVLKEDENIKQDFFLVKFMGEVERLGMSFAFPSQSVYLESMPEALAKLPEGAKVEKR